MLLSYLSYRLKATDAHGIHSPFVYQLYNEVIRASYPHHFQAATAWEKECSSNHELVHFQDFGAGNKPWRSDRISRLHARTRTGGKYGALLHRLAAAFQPEYLLELGTCLGSGTLYTLTGLEKEPAMMVTLEGGEELADIAEQGFSKHGKNEQVHVVRGNIDDTLSKVLQGFPHLDWVYFDANHRLKPTLAYAEACMNKRSNGALFIFDDIHWSKEMEFAWKTLVEDPRCTVTIDLFRLGLIFFREEQAKEHFILRF